MFISPRELTSGQSLKFLFSLNSFSHGLNANVRSNRGGRKSVIFFKAYILLVEIWVAFWTNTNVRRKGTHFLPNSGKWHCLLHCIIYKYCKLFTLFILLLEGMSGSVIRCSAACKIVDGDAAAFKLRFSLIFHRKYSLLQCLAIWLTFTELLVLSVFWPLKKIAVTQSYFPKILKNKFQSYSAH